MIGESVLIRPYNNFGVIAFIGQTEFAPGTWIGVELDAPTGNFFVELFFYFLKRYCSNENINLLTIGKNDGVIQGVRYFTCKPKHGIFVRADKLILDKRGRAMRQYKNLEPTEHPMRRSTSRGIKDSCILCTVIVFYFCP